MPRLYTPEQFIFKVEAKPQATFTASSATQLITSNSHGLSNEDAVLVTNSGGGLPGGLSAATTYYVINATTNTFQLSAKLGGAAVTLSSNGTGTQTFTLLGKKIFVKDFHHVELGFFTANSANLTVKVQISDQESVDFAAAASATNRWSYAQIKNLDDMSTTNGSTGLAPTGTDFAKSYEVNINGKMWLSANFATAGAGYTAGNMNLVATCYHDWS